MGSSGNRSTASEREVCTGKGGEGDAAARGRRVVIGAVALGCASRERLQSEGQRSAVGVGHGDGNGGEGGGDETGGDEGSAADVRVRESAKTLPEANSRTVWAKSGPSCVFWVCLTHCPRV